MEKRYFYTILFASILLLAAVPTASALAVSVAAPDSSSSSKGAATYLCSGSNDQDQVTRAMDAVAASGGGTVSLSEGTFKVGYLSVPGNVVLQGKGPSTTRIVFTGSGSLHLPASGAKLIGVGVSGPAVVWVTAGRVTVQDVTVRSTGLLWAAFSVEKRSSTASVGDIEFRNCQAIDCDTTGFSVSGGSTSYVVTNLRFINCRAVNCGRTSPRTNPYVVGFDLAERVSVDGLLVDGCYASGSWESGFHFESAPSVRNAVLRNCVSENNGLSSDAQWGAGYTVGEGTITENCRSANNQYGWFVHSAGFQASRCVDTGSETSFIFARYLRGAQLVDCGSKSARVTALTGLDQSNLRVTNMAVENCLGTPVLAPRATSSVIDWHYGPVPAIGTTITAPTATPTAAPTQSVLSAGAVPGTIEAENCNAGAEGTAYHDTTAGNLGGAYRNDDVDVEAIAGGYALCYIRDGEWVTYTVPVAAAGQYTAAFRVASWGTAAHAIQVSVNGNLAATVAVPNTGAPDAWTTTSASLSLPAGRCTLRLRFVGDGQNLDRVTTSSVAAQPMASVLFTSAPAGGKLYLDGAYRGVTPLTVTGIPTGIHRAEIRYTGYVTWVKSITVTSDFLTRTYSYNPSLVAA